MKRFALALVISCLAAPPAFAGEKPIGTIVSGAGADTTNDSTATPFFVPFGAKLTVNCTAAANLCIDTSSACTALGGANMGVPVAANINFPTSTPTSKLNATAVVSSGTAANGGATVRIVGTGAVTCYVFLRAGNE